MLVDFFQGGSFQLLTFTMWKYNLLYLLRYEINEDILTILNVLQGQLVFHEKGGHA